MSDEIELFAEGSSVRAEIGGVRVSGLAVNMRRLRIAPGVLVECGGIGGVGTPPEHRGKGLSTKVMAEAMAHMKRLGKHVSALYTGPRIVAHRLYRRFGFADVSRVRERVKYVDLAAFLRRLAERRISRLRGGEPAAGRFLGLDFTMAVDVPGVGRATVQWSAGAAGVSTGLDPAAAITIRIEQDAFTSLANGTMGWSEATALGLASVVRGEAAAAALGVEALFGVFVAPLEGL